MSVYSKSPAVRWFFVLVLGTVGLTAGGREPIRKGSTEAPTVQAQVASVSNAEVGGLFSAPDSFTPRVGAQETKRVAFCLPGEKVYCTLGPPPVCSCR